MIKNSPPKNRKKRTIRSNEPIDQKHQKNPNLWITPSIVPCESSFGGVHEKKAFHHTDLTIAPSILLWCLTSVLFIWKFYYCAFGHSPSLLYGLDLTISQILSPPVLPRSRRWIESILAQRSLYISPCSQFFLHLFSPFPKNLIRSSDIIIYKKFPTEYAYPHWEKNIFMF